MKRNLLKNRLIHAVQGTGSILAALVFPVLLLLPSLINLCVIAEFQINREYISSNLCVNKEVKGSTCKGQCYLKSRLEEKKETANSIPEDNIREEWGGKYLSSNLPELEFMNPPAGNLLPDQGEKLLSEAGNPLFQPPDLSF